MSSPFVHLHVHSHYSLLDGLGKIPEILDRVKELGMDAVALTDHGALYGLVELTLEAGKRGIKPILGTEAYLVPDRARAREANASEKTIRHLTLLAETTDGYGNLLKLITDAHLNGFYRKPCIDYATLQAHHGGLIVLSGCLNGDLPQALLRGDRAEVERLVRWHLDVFGRERYYLELQHHPTIREQTIINEGLKQLARRHGLGLVATGDAHYVHAEDAEAQDVLLCVQTGTKVTDKNRLSMLGEDFSLQPAEQFAEAFRDVPEALANTRRIADRCAVELPFGKNVLPHFPVPAGESSDSYLRKLCDEGLRARFGNAVTPEISERMRYELSVIEKTGFASYFLIVRDFITEARRRGILAQPRGSAAGSLVSYLVEISNVDPLRWGLVFERFLNPERISMPDIDVDFSDDRRDEVLQYVRERYGRDHVAQIITFGTMAARAAVRDTGRALGFPYAFCDKIAKLIPFGLSLTQARATVPDLRRLASEDPQVHRLLETARKLEGVVRHSSIHAAGVVLTPKPLTEYIPLQRASADDETIVTQYEMHAVEDLGLLKIDFLGLKNLTILQHALRIIAETTGETLDLETLPLDDPATYRTLQDGLTTGVFQLESQGMKRYLKELKPTELEDIVAMVSLYRPGPMELIPEYIAGKHGLKKPQYLHPALQPILKKTHGIAVYQEQVLEIARQLAGFTLGQADVLRKAIGKKIPKLLREQREKFVAGARTKGVSKDVAEKVFNFIEPFAGYSFNRCLTGDALVMDAETGRPHSLRSLAERAPQSQRGAVVTLGADFRLTRGKFTRVYRNGVKPVYRLRTRSGREVRATANHPFRTFAGWRELRELCAGDRIAVPRTLPPPQRPRSHPRHELVVLGYILAEGNLCHPHGFYVTMQSREEIADYVRALEMFENTQATVNWSQATPSIYARRRDLRKPSEAVTWLDQTGLRWKRATEKFIPEFVFQLPTADLALFLAKLFQGDGCISVKRKDPETYYATSSPMLARQVQHLFLRLGILTTIHKKSFPYRGSLRPGYALHLSRYDNLRRFMETLGPHLLGQKRQAVRTILTTHPILTGKVRASAARGSKDIVPAAVQPMVRAALAAAGQGPLAFSRATGMSWRLFFADRRRHGYLRETIGILGRALDNEALRTIATSDVYWDEIVEIAPDGYEETFDLTIDGTHNYVANDIIVHNSHAVCYALIAYQTAYLKTHYPAEFLAALLTSDENDTDRIAIEVAECLAMGIPVLPPDVNESGPHFTVVTQPRGVGGGVSGVGTNGLPTPTPNTQRPTPSQEAIRFGLLAVKNVGHGVVEAIIAARSTGGPARTAPATTSQMLTGAGGPFRTIAEFFRRVQTREFNRKAAESLAKAGAFDALGERNQILENLDHLLQLHRNAQRQEAAGQGALFATGQGDAPGVSLRPVPPAPPEQRLRWERELLGLYVSGHPLASVAHLLAGRVTLVKDVGADMTDYSVRVGGILTRVQRTVTRSQQTMVFATLEDQTGSLEVLVFPSVLEADPELWVEERVLLIEGRVSDRDGVPKVICERAESVPGSAGDEPRLLPEEFPHPYILLTVPPRQGRAVLLRLKELLASLPPGPARVYLRIPKNGRVETVRTSLSIRVEPAARERLVALLGPDSIAEAGEEQREPATIRQVAGA